MPSDEVDSLIEAFLEFLSVEKNVSPRTLSNYEHALRAFRSWSGARFSKWENCDPDHFRSYLFDCMKQELARSTIRLHFSALDTVRAGECAYASGSVTLLSLERTRPGASRPAQCSVPFFDQSVLLLQRRR